MTAGKNTSFIEVSRDEGKEAIVLRGDWTVDNAAAIARALAGTGKKAEIRKVDIDRMDTAGAALIRRHFGDSWEEGKFTKRQKALLDFVPVDALQAPPAQKKPPPVRGFFIRVGRGTDESTAFLYGIFSFIGVAAARFFAAFAELRRFRLPSIVRHIDETGIQALPIIGMMAFGISTVVSYQAAVQLRKFGADIYTIDLTVISLLREMGVLATAIMIVGRSGSAFAAEIGVMKLRGEIDAMRTMGIDPVETLVVPRLIALLITLPLLTFFADIVGLAGGGLMVFGQLDISLVAYIHRVQEVATPTMFAVGMVKAPVFAFLIAVICAYQGMKVSGSAEDVGKRTTLAVVQSIFVVVMVDAIFSVIFAKLDI